MIGVYNFPHILYMFEMRRSFTVYCETVGSRVILYSINTLTPLRWLLITVIIVSHFHPSVDLPFLTAKMQQEVTG